MSLALSAPTLMSPSPHTLSSKEEILTLFSHFRDELDEHNDRRERLIKTSRDVTNLSKRIIFLLHRLAGDADLTLAQSTTTTTTSNTTTSNDINNTTKQTTSHPASAFSEAVSKGQIKLAEVQSLLRTMREDLEGDRFWRYQAAISPGLQEYIEALAFAHYLEHGTLVSYLQVQATLHYTLTGSSRQNEKENKDKDKDKGEISHSRDSDGDRTGDDGNPEGKGKNDSETGGGERQKELFKLPYDDYLLGVSDLTGELMRFAISAITSRGGRQVARQVSDFVRNCKADFEMFTPYVKSLSRKQTVTSQSLQKIEDAAYAIAVRASEYGGTEEELEEMVARCVSEVIHHGTEEGKREYCGMYGSDE